MLKVLVITGNAIVGGMEISVLRLVRALPRDEYSVVALVPFDGAFGDELRAAGASVYATPMPASPCWRSIQFAAELVRRSGVGLIHAHLARAHQLAAIVGRATRTPVLATIHAMHIEMHDLEAHRLGGTHLCLVSDAARMHALGVGASPERVRVVCNAVDASLFSPSDVPASEAGVAIGYVGRLSPEKNPLLFVSLAARVAQAVPDARFIVAGDGPLREAMQSRASEYGVADRFEFRGVVGTMPALYRTLDLVVLPSWHEGTPLTILEAMASGVPVVATAVGGVPELVAAGVTGLLFEAGNEADGGEAVLELAQDADRRRRMGREARARVLARFTWAQHVAAVTSAWRELTADGRRRTLRAYRAEADEAAVASRRVSADR